MSRIVVIGAHGRTGLLIVEHLVKAGDSVVAVIRNPKQMADLVKRGAETVLLDLEASSGPEFAAQFKGADAIVFAAGSASGDSSAIDSKGVRKTLRATAFAGMASTRWWWPRSRRRRARARRCSSRRARRRSPTPSRGWANERRSRTPTRSCAC